MKKTAVAAPAAATPSARQPLVIARLHQELGSFIVGNMRVTLPKNMKEYEPARRGCLVAIGTEGCGHTNHACHESHA